MTIAGSSVTRINKMNRASQDAALGTLVQTIESDLSKVTSACAILHNLIASSGSHVVTAAEASASMVNLVNPQATHGFMFQYFRSGSPYPNWGGPAATSASGIKYVYNNTSGSLSLRHYGDSGSILAGDVVTYLLF